ncbi:pilus assembly protein N-terminal domain-containing protein [Vibrio nomapromontoriensis]
MNDAITLELKRDIETVFVSDPDIIDFKVINKRKLVIFSNEIGSAKLIVFGNENVTLLQEYINVDLDLRRLRRELKLYFPKLDISVESIGEKIAVRGFADSQNQTEEIYKMVATFAGKKRIPRYVKVDKIKIKRPSGDDSEEPNWVAASRNYMWEDLIEAMTVRSTKQVNVKVSLAQVTQEFNETIGVDWSTVGQTAGSFNFLQFKADDLTTLISAIGNDNLAEILAEPNLTVLSGESAQFLVGGEVPVVVTNNNSTNITFKNFGVGMELSALVLDDDNIKLQIAPEVSAVERYVQAAGIEVPQFSTRRAFTTIQLGDGESFMLGGLMSSEEIEEMSKLPILGDIPYLGAAFRKAGTTRKKTELVIIATVNLVESQEESSFSYPKIESTSIYSRLFALKPDESDDISEIERRQKYKQISYELMAKGGFIQ